MVYIITVMREGAEIRAVRYRVLPGTRAKARHLNRLAGACRYVWNVTLDDQQILHDTARMFGASAPPPTFFTLGKGFTDLRNSNGHEWLKELPFAVVRYTLKRQADAWQRFFKGHGGRPRFKGRGRGRAAGAADGRAASFPGPAAASRAFAPTGATKLVAESLMRRTRWSLRT